MKIGGYIGENSEFFEVNLNGVKHLHIDLNDVNYLNSVGVKNWIAWTRKLRDDLMVTFSNCPPLFVNQMNNVVDFLPKSGSVDSFYVQYYCDNCATEKNVLLEKGKHFDFATETSPRRVEVADSIECPKCKGPMELDVFKDKYFLFLDKK